MQSFFHLSVSTFSKRPSTNVIGKHHQKNHPPFPIDFSIHTLYPRTATEEYCFKRLAIRDRSIIAYFTRSKPSLLLPAVKTFAFFGIIKLLYQGIYNVVLSVRWHTSASPSWGCLYGRIKSRILLLLHLCLLKPNCQHGDKKDFSLPQGCRRYSGWNDRVGECRSNHDGLPFLQSQRSIFYANSNSIGGWANVHILQMCEVQLPMEREINE